MAMGRREKRERKAVSRKHRQRSKSTQLHVYLLYCVTRSATRLENKPPVSSYHTTYRRWAKRIEGFYKAGWTELTGRGLG